MTPGVFVPSGVASYDTGRQIPVIQKKNARGRIPLLGVNN